MLPLTKHRCATDQCFSVVYAIRACVLFAGKCITVGRRNDAILIYIHHHLCDRLSRGRLTWAHLRVMTYCVTSPRRGKVRGSWKWFRQVMLLSIGCHRCRQCCGRCRRSCSCRVANSAGISVQSQLPVRADVGLPGWR